MKNDNIKCGLNETLPGHLSDEGINNNAYIWYEENWQHDAYQHLHNRSQLTYVEQGYQYFYINQKIYLVPQNHVIWIPENLQHRTTSEAEKVNLMVVLYNPLLEQDFYKDVHVFAAPSVLKEMLLYAAKWNKQLIETEEQKTFLKALYINLPSFCKENNSLQIPIPTDNRLMPVCDIINANYHYPIETDDLAAKANLSVRTMQRIFKQQTGITIQKYIQLIRILKSIELIDTKRYTLTEIAYKVGYQSLSAFSSTYLSVMKERPKLKK